MVDSEMQIHMGMIHTPQKADFKIGHQFVIELGVSFPFLESERQQALPFSFKRT